MVKHILAFTFCVTLAGVTGAAEAAPFVQSSSAQAEALGWKAGEVAPSPLVPRFSDPTFSSIQEAQEARRFAQEELDRVAKIRLHQTALCNKKFLVNQCMNKAEKVLREREQIAHQLLRTADHQIRLFKTAERTHRNQGKVSSMPTKRGTIDRADRLNEKAGQQAQRRAQESANEAAFAKRLEENADRRAKLQAEAEKRKADREARQARYAKERAEREEAQRRQAESKGNSASFF